ncbi:hypothetical protein VTK56DRAFT_9910 [Thermocarpiscus australiensis]
MSSRRPSIPLRMAGGRPQPGICRPGTPGSVRPLFAPGGSFFGGTVAAAAAPAAPEFGGESPRLDEPDHRGPGPEVSASGSLPPTALPTAGQLYGQLHVGAGCLRFEATDRMQDWLGQSAVSLGDTADDAGPARAEVGSAGEDGSVVAGAGEGRGGEKRRAVSFSSF